MDKSCRLSIVIPVYDTEEYVERCIRSCMEQNILSDEYEVIVINDGSTDDSLAEVLKLSAEYPQIRVYSQPNSGLSMARNAGMDKAVGEYVWFVDSDDSIRENSLEQILDASSCADIIALGCDFHEKVISGEEFLVRARGRFLHGAPYYVFRRKFLYENALRFFPGIFHEDSEFTPRALALARSVASVSQECYCRSVREGSITRTVNVKRAYDLLFVISRLEDFVMKNLPKGQLRSQMLRLFPLLANSSLNVMSDADPSLWDEYIREFRRKGITAYYLRSADLKYIAEGLLLRMSRNPVAIYRFFKKA